MNIKSALLALLKKHNKTPADVVWVGGDEYEIADVKFWDLINTESENKYSVDGIATDLIVSGDGWWITVEYWEGHYMFVFNEPPVRPQRMKMISAITTEQSKDQYGDYHFNETIDELNSYCDFEHSIHGAKKMPAPAVSNCKQ